MKNNEIRELECEGDRKCYLKIYLFRPRDSTRCRIWVAIMYIEHVKNERGEKVHTQILLRESYCVNGAVRSAAKHRTQFTLSRRHQGDVRRSELPCDAKATSVPHCAIRTSRCKRGSANAVYCTIRIHGRIIIRWQCGMSEHSFCR